jgi:hypothetical protein
VAATLLRLRLAVALAWRPRTHWQGPPGPARLGLGHPAQRASECRYAGLLSGLRVSDLASGARETAATASVSDRGC